MITEKDIINPKETIFGSEYKEKLIECSRIANELKNIRDNEYDGFPNLDARLTDLIKTLRGEIK